MTDKEIMAKFRVFEQQVRLIQEQLQAVEQAIMNLGEINFGLGELVGKTNSEILAPIGRGIFVNAKLLSEELIVDIGGKNFVKKSIPETQKTLKEQVNKLDGIREELNKEMEKINEEITSVFMESQGHGHSHVCNCGDNEECSCGDDCECSDGECECGEKDRSF
jgi:prefoldin alpha subunit